MATVPRLRNLALDDLAIERRPRQHYVAEQIDACDLPSDELLEIGEDRLVRLVRAAVQELDIYRHVGIDGARQSNRLGIVIERLAGPPDRPADHLVQTLHTEAKPVEPHPEARFEIAWLQHLPRHPFEGDLDVVCKSEGAT